MVNYILYSVAGLAISFLLYRVILKTEKSFLFNRFYLLGTLVLCLVAPTLQLDWGTTFPQVKKIQFEQAFTAPDTQEAPEQIKVEVLAKRGYPLKQIGLYLYLSVTGLFLLRFTRNLYRIIKLIKNSSQKSFNNLKIIDLKEKGKPFSFFAYLFIHHEDLSNKIYAKSIITHEMAHSKGYHSADIIFLELLGCFYWFNPFIWLYKKEILENHEYLADAAVVHAGVDVATYSWQLIQSGDCTRQALISGFSFIKTKNRLNMLYTRKSSKVVSSLKTGIVLLLFAGVFTISSFSTVNNSAPFVVVVDAGHGGSDSGSFNEKEINLQVSRELQALSKDSEVKIILIRNKDQFLNLADRLNFIKAQKADLLLSLHCNSSNNQENRGIEAFYAPDGMFQEKSYDYSKILISQYLSGITDKGALKTANFKILKDSPQPGVLLELGYITNQSDAIRLRDPAQQKLIAANIYAGLQKIKAFAAR